MSRTMNVPRRSEGGVALAAAAPAPAHTPAPDPNHGGPAGGAPGASDGATPIKREEEEEETLGQLRDRQAPGFARAPGPRATFVHIKVEDSSSGDDTDGDGGGGDGEEATGEKGDREELDEEEEEAEDAEVGDVEEGTATQRAHASVDSGQEGKGAVRPRRLLAGARSAPGSPRPRLLAPRRVAVFAVQDNNVQLPPEKDEDEASFAPVLRKRDTPGRPGSSQFAGVSWNTSARKWLVRCKGSYLGWHATEEEAARSRTASILLSTERTSPRTSRVSAGTRSPISGRRNASGHTWVITPRRKLRRLLTASKLRASVSPSTLSRPPVRKLRRGRTVNPSRTALFRGAPPHRSSRVSAGTRPKTDGWRSARARSWAVTPRKMLRHGRTTSKLSALDAPSTSSCPLELPVPAEAWMRALTRGRAWAVVRVWVRAAALPPSALRRRHLRHPR